MPCHRYPPPSILRLALGCHLALPAAFHWQATVFISASADRTVRVWDVRQPAHAMVTVQAHDSSVALPPSGNPRSLPPSLPPSNRPPGNFRGLPVYRKGRR